MPDPTRSFLTRRHWLALAAAGAASRCVPSCLGDGPAGAGRWGGEVRGRKAVAQPGRVYGVAFSRDGTKAATGGFDPGTRNGWVAVWDAETWDRVASYRVEEVRVYALAFTPDGGALVVSGFNPANLALVDAFNGRNRLLHENKEGGDVGGPVVFSPDDELMVSGHGDGLMVWDTATWERLQVIPGTRDRGWDLVPVRKVGPGWKTAGGWFLALDAPEGRVKRPENRTTIPGPEPRPPRADDPSIAMRWGLSEPVEGVDRPVWPIRLAYTPEGPSAALTSSDDTRTVRLALYDATRPDRWERRAGVVLGKAGAVPQGLAFSPDGRVLFAGCSDGLVRRWRADDGRERPALEGHNGVVFGLAFSPDGSTLATAGMGDKTVRLWSPD